MKKYFLKDSEGSKIFVGYKINKLFDLYKMGYCVPFKSMREDFYKYRKRGVVYVDQNFLFLYSKYGMQIPIYPRSISDDKKWNERLLEIKKLDKDRSGLLGRKR